MTNVLIGKIVESFGVHGLVKIKSFAHKKSDIFNYKLFNKNKIISLTLKHQAKENFVSQIAVNDNIISSKEDADDLKGLELFILKDEIDTNEDEYLQEDLVGMNVFYENENIGQVTKVLNFGASDILEIKLLDNKSVLIPFTDSFVDVNVDDKTVILKKSYQSFL
jgi:16S rRNA processing protein RimM